MYSVVSMSLLETKELSIMSCFQHGNLESCVKQCDCQVECVRVVELYTSQHKKELTSYRIPLEIVHWVSMPICRITTALFVHHLLPSRLSMLNADQMRRCQCKWETLMVKECLSMVAGMYEPFVKASKI